MPQGSSGARTRRIYASKVRQYLVWLAGPEVDGDPLGTADGRDWAVRDYRGSLQTVLKRRRGPSATRWRRWTLSAVAGAGPGES